MRSEIEVGVPPELILERLSAVTDKSRLANMFPDRSKRFVGKIEGNKFEISRIFYGSTPYQVWLRGRVEVRSESASTVVLRSHLDPIGFVSMAASLALVVYVGVAGATWLPTTIWAAFHGLLWPLWIWPEENRSQAALKKAMSSAHA